MPKACLVCQSSKPILCICLSVSNLLQTTDNACATIALLNIVMNSAGIDLGDALAAFKKSTRKLKPAYRGKKLGENDYIRNIHNSFVR